MGRPAVLGLCAAILAAGGGFITAAGSQTSGRRVGNPDQGRRVVEAKCAACHGADGNGADPRYPKLSGEDPAYLDRQLWAFRSGTRRSEVMAGIAADLSDAEMADAASFFARQGRRPDAVADPRLAAVGERVFFGGSGGMTPPCAMCHGAPGQRGMPMMGRGMMGNAPRLNGQHAAYIVDERNEFATGERRFAIMNRVASTLGEADRKAVAEYLSGLR